MRAVFSWLFYHGRRARGSTGPLQPSDLGPAMSPCNTTTAGCGEIASLMLCILLLMLLAMLLLVFRLSRSRLAPAEVGSALTQIGLIPGYSARGMIRLASGHGAGAERGCPSQPANRGSQSDQPGLAGR